MSLTEATTARERSAMAAVRQPGSDLAEEKFRASRAQGMDENTSILRVYLFGRNVGLVHGRRPLGPNEQVSDVDEAHAVRVYRGQKAAGRHHREALDEVLLVGYLYGKTGVR